MFNSADKIVDWAEARHRIEAVQAEGKKVVFTNGCFDLVHLGHVDYLEKARNLGDFMVVALNSDPSVSSLKGPNRPVANEKSRTRVMASFGFVDLVVVFSEPTPLEVIQHLKPDILTKGADYTIETIVGAEFVMARGGKVETIPLIEGYSTSLLIKRINET